ncbi:MAG TPA: hypothetical protein VKU00_26635 [Chthonomonadaceae bacterium]|nr:hypothetical protein [Chthonomonadaceae bacterium]
MKEEVLRVSLKDITGFRLNCSNCGGSIELPLSEMPLKVYGTNGRIEFNGKCKICGYTYDMPRIADLYTDPIIRFVQALEEIKGIDPKMEIEIVIPQSVKNVSE